MHVREPLTSPAECSDRSDRGARSLLSSLSLSRELSGRCGRLRLLGCARRVCGGGLASLHGPMLVPCNCHAIDPTRHNFQTQSAFQRRRPTQSEIRCRGSCTNPEKIKGRCPGGWDHPVGCQDGCCGRWNVMGPLQYIVSRSHYVIGVGLLGCRRRADAVPALLVAPDAVRPPGTFDGLRQDTRQPPTSLEYFCTLDMSSARGDMAQCGPRQMQPVRRAWCGLCRSTERVQKYTDGT